MVPMFYVVLVVYPISIIGKKNLIEKILINVSLDYVNTLKSKKG